MGGPRKIKNFYKRPNQYRSIFFSKLSEKPNLFIIYKTVALIMVWVGVWGLIDEFLFPNNPALRYVLVLIGGLFLLYIDDGSLDELTDFNPSKYKYNEKKITNDIENS